MTTHIGSPVNPVIKISLRKNNTDHPAELELWDIGRNVYSVRLLGRVIAFLKHEQIDQVLDLPEVQALERIT